MDWEMTLFVIFLAGLAVAGPLYGADTRDGRDWQERDFWERARDLPRTVLMSFVDHIDDGQWAHLTLRTLDATDGQMDDSISVADRAARIPPSSTSRELLLRLLDNGEHWERHHAAIKALGLLRVSTAQPAADSFRRLRTRLIDLGHHEAITFNRPNKIE